MPEGPPPQGLRQTGGRSRAVVAAEAVGSLPAIVVGYAIRHLEDAGSYGIQKVEVAYGVDGDAGEITFGRRPRWR